MKYEWELVDWKTRGTLAGRGYGKTHLIADLIKPTTLRRFLRFNYGSLRAGGCSRLRAFLLSIWQGYHFVRRRL